MSKSKSTKRALLCSIMSLIICFAMLIGTTFAWFTDSVSSTGNKIQAGTLNIDLLVKGDDGYESVKADKAAIFNYDKWEPGYTEVKNIMVKTTGNLALKYTLKITAKGEVSKLAEVIDVYYAASEVTVAGRTLTGLTKIGTLKDVLDGVDGTIINDTLIPGRNTEDYATLALKMQETAGIEYQGLSIGSSFDLNLVAAQHTYEKDSFDDQYDANATYEIPVNPNAQTVSFDNYSTDTEFVLNNYTDLKAFANELNVNGKSFSGKTVKLGADIDLGNTEWTPIGQTRSNGTATYFQGTFDGDNHTIKNLAISASAWDEGANYAAGLFGFIDNGSATIKNLTIDGARVEGHHWAGAVVGYLTGTVENCHVKNATVISTHANDDACGDKVGAVVGYINTGDSVVSGCTAYNCTIKAGRDAGQIVGCNTVSASVTDCSAELVTVEATGDCTHSNAGGNIKNEIVGRS